MIENDNKDDRKCLTVECDSRGTSGLRRSTRWPDSDHETAGLPAFLDIFLIVNKFVFLHGEIKGCAESESDSIIFIEM